MSDVFSTAKRSEVMSRIKGRGNRGTELAFVALMRTYRITGWRRHLPIDLGPLSGRPVTAEAQGRRRKVRPDFVFPAHRLAIFIDGCFWHGCPKHLTPPASNKAFWEKKLSSNKQRDRFVSQALRRQGWSVLRVWEHELSTPRSVYRRLQLKIERAVQRGFVGASRR